jgi:hypothetical protein
MQTDPESRAKFIRQRAPQLENPNVMGAFRQQLEGMNLGPSVTQTVNQWLSQAFPDSFAKSTQMLTGNFQELSKPTVDLTKGFSDLRAPVLKLPPELGNAGDAAQSFAERLNTLTLTAPPTVAGAHAPALPGIPSITLNPQIPLPKPPAQSPVLKSSLVPDRTPIVIDPSIARSAFAYASPGRTNVARPDASGPGETHINKRTIFNVYATPSMNEAALVDQLKRKMARDEERA